MATADPAPSKDVQIGQLTDLVRTLNDKLAAAQAGAQPAPNGPSLDPAVQKKLVESQIVSIQQQIDFAKEQLANYEFGMLAAYVLLTLTVVVVAAGVTFCGLQLHHAMKIGAKEDGTFEVSLSGLRMTSSIMGILVLGISVLFVYMILNRIYPIQN